MLVNRSLTSSVWNFNSLLLIITDLLYMLRPMLMNMSAIIVVSAMGTKFLDSPFISRLFKAKVGI
ncbi:MAG: hypothetical protein ACKO13_13875 [Cytophagales bacterium]